MDNFYRSHEQRSQEKKEQQKRKEARKAKSAQLPAHGEVQKMEASLLKLLNDFNSGQLRAFDSAYSLEEMESVRDKQEAIARYREYMCKLKCLHLNRFFIGSTLSWALRRTFTSLCLMRAWL